GRMGDAFNPILIDGDPSRPDYAIDGFKSLPSVGLDRLALRRHLLESLEATHSPKLSLDATQAESFSRHAEQAYSMLEQPAFGRAANIATLSPREREPYGPTKFGQSLLLARRFVEAGIP